MTRIHPSYSGPLVFGGSACRHLLQPVCDYLNLEAGRLEISKFADGETGVKVLDNIRGADVYVIQSTAGPVNESLMELLLTIDAMVRASAERINVIMPYFGYARQDRKDQGRVALSAKLVANLLVEAGASRIICIDLHSPQIQGFFDIPVDHLYAKPVLLEYLTSQPWANDLVVVSPDVGNVKMTRSYASYLNAPLAIIDKRRPRANVSEVMNIVGDVRGRSCLIVDDLIDTAGTLCNAADALCEAGATSVMAMASHPVLSGPARERIQASCLERVILTNTIARENDEVCQKLEIVSIAPLIAEAIHRVHNYLSVSELFEPGYEPMKVVY